MTHAELAHVEEASRTATAWLPDYPEHRARLVPRALRAVLMGVGLAATATLLLLTAI